MHLYLHCRLWVVMVALVASALGPTYQAFVIHAS